MQILSITSPVYSSTGGVMLEVNLGTVGFVTYHATPDDIEEQGRILFDRATRGEFGAIAPYVAPSPTVPDSITPRQGYIILSRYGLLTPVQSYFAALTGQPGEEARIELEYAQEWRRDWPTLTAAATSFGLTDSQIDQMFIEAAQL
jgi:hypothetical protein